MGVPGGTKMSRMPDNNVEFVTIVSGLPRSGTSLMMRMLEAGGLPVLIDGVRTADTDNPGGYYEFERVKQIERDKSWVESARGKAVKMVYRLLYPLPPEFDYRIVFMRRDLTEVIRSQNKMLERSGKDGSGLDDQKMIDLFDSELKRILDWLDKQPNMEFRQVSYNALLQDAEPVVNELQQFLGPQLDTGAMLEVIDPALYRNRG